MRKHGNRGTELVRQALESYLRHACAPVELHDTVNGGTYRLGIERKGVDPREPDHDDHENELAGQRDQHAIEHDIAAGLTLTGQITETDTQKAEPEGEEKSSCHPQKSTGDNGGNQSPQTGPSQTVPQPQNDQRCRADQGDGNPHDGEEMAGHEQGHGQGHQKRRFDESSCGSHAVLPDENKKRGKPWGPPL